MLGAPTFIGATAGLRYAMEQKVVAAEDIDALHYLLPKQCELRLLSPEDEARYELLATRALTSDPCGGMLSMGGRSMQIGWGSAAAPNLQSLPFAAFVGVEQLAASAGTWSERISACRERYQDLCAAAQERQGLPLLSGMFFCVTDTLDVAEWAGLTNHNLSAARLVAHLGARLDTISRELHPEENKRRVLLEIARAIAVETVAARLFSPDAEFAFMDLQVSWTFGFFLDNENSRV